LAALRPPNYARLLSSLGGYVYSVYGDNTAGVHLYAGGKAVLTIAAGR
jgi:DUF1680 family protein